MDGTTFFERILPLWRPVAVAEVGEAYFDGFIRRRRGELIGLLDQLLVERAAKLGAIKAPPDEWTPARRAKANLAAMQIIASLKPKDITAAERRTLLGYSGWGGLSIEKYQDQFPKGWDPDSFGLVHEYYTPTKLARAVADALCPFLPDLAGRDGVIRALEPSAGIGRFMLALNQGSCEHPPLRWTAIELSTIAAKMLPLLFPEADVCAGSFEEWLHRQTGRKGIPAKGVEVTARDAGKFRLLVANPPYGKRGLTAKWDQAPEYAEREAFAYFLRRGLDLLAPYGIGVFLIPAGFLTGTSSARRELRERVLRRHHLMSAFRLPSATFPGANLVTDLLFFRARGGELAEVDEGDLFIAEGRYFDEFPNFILGEEKGRGDEDDALDRPSGRHRHQVLGNFEGLPPFAERTLCSACIVRPVAFPAATASRLVRRAASSDDLTPLLAAAVTLGNRVADYLAERAQGSRRAVELWPELLQSLRDFQKAPEVEELGVRNPWAWMELRQLAEQDASGAQHFLNAFSKSGELTAALTTRPTIEEHYSGEPHDLLGQAEYLYRSRRRITIDELLDFHQDQGGQNGRSEALERLFRADWCVDGGDLGELIPLRDYVTGDLWPKLDRLDFFLGGAPQVEHIGLAGEHAGSPSLRGPRGDRPKDIPVAQLESQRKRLLLAIHPVEFEDIGEVSPGDGYVPLDLISAWVSEHVNGHFGAVALERADGLVRVADAPYDSLKKEPLDPETLWFVGWLNHDNTFFGPPDLHPQDPEADKVRAEVGLKGPSVWDRRASYERGWKIGFNAWLREEPARMERVRDAYNRSFRRYVRREYSSEPVDIARWGGQIRLAPHQNAATRRVLEARGGLLAFDVGVGKTYTGLAILARARQEGWGRRPVVLVPPSLLWKWYRDFQRCLPDYRVAVIGATRRQLSKGKRVKAAAARLASGEITKEQYRQLITVSRADKPDERAAKWSAFQAGLYDAVILSYEALKMTNVDLDAILRYAENTPAIRRVISLQERNEKTRGKRKAKKQKKATERKRAIAEAGVKGFVLERLEVDERRQLDPGIRWEDLGVDLLIVDEAQNFKNLYAPEPREGGIPKFMGLPAGGSKRAWQLDFRSSFVRQRTGGSGVVLLSATPAKNSPLEFYNILQYVDHDAFSKVGIHDPEDFIDRYLKIEGRDVLDANFDIVRKSAVVGFRRLDELRAILDRYSEFRTAEEVGIKLPKPRVQRVDVAMDDAQEEKYDVLVQAMTERLKDLIEGRGAESSAILGDMVRMSLIALHSQLDEGYDWDTALEGGRSKRKVTASALPRWLEREWEVLDINEDKGSATITRELPPPDPMSPKFQAVAERVAAQTGCGHIIFCEPVACHVWIREVLIANGIPKERIAIMNAAATDTNARIRIADGFNGDEEAGIDPTYDVVIANSVAYEGVDLQVRTCAIHHVDLPWTPADLEQRNGRAYRQGNTLGTIEILYYIAQGSMDGYRFSVIHGKRGWLADLLESQDRDTNNPAAQQDFSPEELLEYIARDKSGVKELLAKRKAQRREEERHKQAVNAAMLMRQAVSRFRSARRLAASEPERAAKLREEAEERLTSLARGAGDAWPWTSVMYAFREVDGLVPSDGGAPVFEGMRVVQRGRDGEALAYEFGRVRERTSGAVIGMRRAGESHWSLVGGTEIQELGISPEDLQHGDDWPADDDAGTDAALTRAIARMNSWTNLGWEGASEAFVGRWWGRRGSAIAEQLARRGVEDERLPVLIDGELRLKSGPALRDGELLPPTADGWSRYLQLAPLSDEVWTALRDVGDRWWGRRIPRDLLKHAPEIDDETALVRLQRKLREAREAHAIGPRELVEWFDDNDFGKAAEALEAYLDRPTKALAEFAGELRKLIDDELDDRWHSITALTPEGARTCARGCCWRRRAAATCSSVRRAGLRGGCTSTRRRSRARPSRSPRATSRAVIACGTSIQATRRGSRRSGLATQSWSARSSWCRRSSARPTTSSGSRPRRSRARSASAISEAGRSRRCGPRRSTTYAPATGSTRVDPRRSSMRSCKW
ncbi:MAG: SNF2-related protein [Nannocystaceae bacterium]